MAVLPTTTASTMSLGRAPISADASAASWLRPSASSLAMVAASSNPLRAYTSRAMTSSPYAICGFIAPRATRV